VYRPPATSSCGGGRGRPGIVRPRPNRQVNIRGHRVDHQPRPARHRTVAALSPPLPDVRQVLTVVAVTVRRRDTCLPPHLRPAEPAQFSRPTAAKRPPWCRTRSRGGRRASTLTANERSTARRLHGRRSDNASRRPVAPRRRGERAGTLFARFGESGGSASTTTSSRAWGVTSLACPRGLVTPSGKATGQPAPLRTDVRERVGGEAGDTLPRSRTRPPSLAGSFAPAFEPAGPSRRPSRGRVEIAHRRDRFLGGSCSPTATVDVGSGVLPGPVPTDEAGRRHLFGERNLRAERPGLSRFRRPGPRGRRRPRRTHASALTAAPAACLADHRHDHPPLSGTGHALRPTPNSPRSTCARTADLVRLAATVCWKNFLLVSTGSARRTAAAYGRSKWHASGSALAALERGLPVSCAGCPGWCSISRSCRWQTATSLRASLSRCTSSVGARSRRSAESWICLDDWRGLPGRHVRCRAPSAVSVCAQRKALHRQSSSCFATSGRGRGPYRWPSGWPYWPTRPCRTRRGRLVCALVGRPRLEVT